MLVDYLKNLLFSEMSDSEGDLSYINETCNSILTKNNTLIEIDRGWEGIPESLVINIGLCLFLGLCFIFVRVTAHRKQLKRQDSDEKYNSWLEFIYGDRLIVAPHHSSIRKLCKDQKYNRIFFESLRFFLPFHGDYRTHTSSPSVGSNESNQATRIGSPIDTDAIIPVEGDEYHDPSSDETILRNVTASSNPLDRETTFSARNSFIYSADLFRRFLPGGLIFYINSWVSNILYISDFDIFQKKGPDAHQYLQFERYLILFFSFLSFICVIIILPVNVQGNNEGKAFQRTTLSNLPVDSDLIWIHAIFATLVVLVGVALMNNFSKNLRTDDDLMSRKTLLFRRLPDAPENELKEKLKSFIEEKFPDQGITGIQLLFDVRKLGDLELRYVNILNAIEYSHRRNAKLTNGMIQIRPYCCGRMCGCLSSCCCSQVDALEFHEKERNKVKEKIVKELESIPKRRTGSAFVSFKTEKTAMKVYRELKQEQNNFVNARQIYRLCSQGTEEQFSLRNSLICYAPYPSDINWRDISANVQYIWLKKVLLYLFLFIVFFFLSTPAIALKLVEVIANKETILKGIGRLTSTWTEFLSPLMLMLMAIILPSIVTYACSLIPFKTISALNHAVMSKVYFYLLMMIIILPSAGFISINAMLDNIVSSHTSSSKFRWNCLFPVNNGAFFVIYTLQAAILGNTVEILRIPELSLYIFHSIFLRSSVEFQNARKMITFEFPIGVSYARLLLIYTMTITYSIACPMIAPCGLFYMICKHLVDRYNIYNIYTPSKIDGRIHSSAILYVHIGLILMLFQVFAFCITKTQYSYVTVYLLIVLLIALLVFAFHCFYHWFRNINHITYGVTTKRNSKKRDLCICLFIPPVFYNVIDDGLLNPAV